MSRRRFLSLLAAGGLGATLAACAPLTLTPTTRETPTSTIRAGRLTPILVQSDPSVEAGGVSIPRPGAFTLRQGVTRGVYESPVYQTDFSFNGAALTCTEQTPEGSLFLIEMRSGTDGRQWSEWFGAPEACGATTEGDVFHSQLVGVQGRYLQYRLTLSAADPDRAPTVGDIKIDYIDSSQGPSITRPQGVGPDRRPSDASQPPVISRSAWGCPEPSSSDRWPPEYKQWTMIALHDTVTKNNDPNPAATVRAIWYYHANTLGWGDIGYNYLVDTLGNIYEGRFGGENATGAHVRPCYNPGSIGIALLGDYRYADVTPEMETALVSLLAAKTYQHNIDPMGSSDFGGYDQYDKGNYYHLWLGNIFAHRDLSGSCGNNHTDPGTFAYDRMQQLRQQAKNSYITYGESWVSNNSPSRLLTGATATVAVTVKNTGSRLWSVADKFRLGYRWYAQSGSEVLQAGGGYQRTELPADVPSGQTVTINAQITAPAGAGTYTLQWDMVQEGVTWFASQGNSPLNVTVLVEEPTYIAEFVSQAPPARFLPGNKYQAWFELKNTGTVTWYRGGSNPVRLGTSNPTDRTSPIVTPGSWPNPARAAYLDQDKVSPGQTGRFSFVATAPSQPGLYRENFRLVAEGKTWFGPAMYIDFIVPPVSKTFLPNIRRRVETL